MFLKSSDKKEKNTGKTYRYYKLCESYRIGDKIRHRTLFILGKLDEITTNHERKLLADRIEQLLVGSNAMFSSGLPENIEKLAMQFSSQIQRKGLYNSAVKKNAGSIVPDQKRDYQSVDLSSIEMEDVREIGIEWLCKQAIKELGLEAFLLESGFTPFQAGTAMMHLISKASYPASEHKTAQWINDNSSVAELYGRQPSEVNRFQLYEASRMLYGKREVIEQYLSVKTNELFDLHDKIILYDLTNTYFEGRKTGSQVAKFHRSKEKRSDAKLVALALVVNIEGFVKYSRIYRGNIADCKTLEDTINHLSSRTSSTGRKPIVVIDAGIATEDNLAMLRSNQYNYVCVSRSRLKDYQVTVREMLHLEDKRGNPIDVQWVEKLGDQDQYLYVHSRNKALKEASMEEHFSHRYEEELDNVARAIHRKGGTKIYGKVMERIGRIKERYPSANKHYEIEVSQDNGKVVEVTWKRKALPAPSGDGTYFIRTNISQSDEALIWDIYNTIRQVEEAFRILKSDLSLRPVFHKSDENTIPHLFLGILAYMVVNTIRHRLKKKGIHHDWSNIVRIMNTQKAGTVTLEKQDGKKVHIRLCSKPTQGALEIYETMGYKPMPFHRKKFVFPEF